MKNAVLLPILLCGMLMTDGFKFLTGENKASAVYCFYVQMYDSYGDGWNGASYSIYNWNDSLVATGTLTTGTYDWDFYCMADGCYTISVSGGSFSTEISWDIWSNTDGELAYGYAPANYVPVTLGSPFYGCTDYYACNYDSYATCDNGSCCYDNCVFLSLHDSFGDGWNGAWMYIYDNTGGLVNSSTVLADSNYVELCLPMGCYTVEVTGGDYPSEVSWSIYQYDSYYGTSELLANGDAFSNAQMGVGGACEGIGCTNPNSCNFNVMAAYSGGPCCLDNCIYIYMYDSFGDGWNNAEFVIRDWNGDVRHHGTLYDSDYGLEQLCLPDGCYTIEVTGGYFSNEVSWILYNPNYVYQNGVANSMYPFSVGPTNILGCTDPEAGNYNADATCDNGSCTVTCNADLNGDGSVNVTDLLLFMSEFGTSC